MVSEARLDELLPQLPEDPAERKAILARAKAIVSEFWPDGTDPILALALQVVVQLPPAKLDAMRAVAAMTAALQLAA